METLLPIQVMMKYRNKLEVTMATRGDVRLSSMENFRRVIFENFPEVENHCQNSGRGWSSFKLDLQYEDREGDLIPIDSDEDLKNVFVWEMSSTMKFRIDVKTGEERGRLAGSQSNSPRGFNNGNIMVSRTQAPQPCRFFAAGYCRNGISCRFAHDGNRDSEQRTAIPQPMSNPVYKRALSLPSSTSSISNALNTLNWLRQQVNRAASENIEFLSSEHGIEELSKIVEQRSLSMQSIEILVNLLAKDEFRLSLMRENTNKVYAILMGSPFLLQLHGHIASKLGNVKAQDLMPYLLFIEELQSRTTDGWKEVPLDAINTVIQNLEEGSAKSELVTTVNRLLDYRGKLRRQAALSSSSDNVNRFLGGEFRSLSIVPTKEELLQPHLADDLPVNQVGMRYSSVSTYLETHFRLLREDCIHPLREGIEAYRNKKSSRELRIYQEVRLVGYRCGNEGLEFVMSFRVQHRINFGSSKRLMFGALLCISSDEFQNSFTFGVVTGRNFEGTGATKLTVWIRALGKLEEGAPFDVAKKYVMVESTAAYFEAYYHVLKGLQREDMENIPFTKYLLNLEQEVDPPFYLQRRHDGDKFDFASVFPSMKSDLGRSTIHILKEWPKWSDNLDEAQRQALKHGLTKELSIIQGPPGTGKTFLGLRLVQLLLSNFPQRDHALADESDEFDSGGPEIYGRKGPILVICMTNHALDQFLEGISKFESNLVRIGGRSKSPSLLTRNLKHLLEDRRRLRLLERSHHRAHGRRWHEKGEMESMIHRTIDRLGEKVVGGKQLVDVATEAQIRNLFPIDLRDSTTIQSWMNGDENPLLAYPHLGPPTKELFASTNIDLGPTPVEELFTYHMSGRGDEAGYEHLKKEERGKVKMLARGKEVEDGNEWTVVPWRRNRRGAQNPRGLAKQMANMYVNLEAAEADVMEVIPSDIDGAEEVEEEGWTGSRDEVENVQEELDGDDPQEIDVEEEGNGNEVRLVDFIDTPDVWQLNMEQRRVLHDYWLAEVRRRHRQELEGLTGFYEQICRKIREVEDEMQLTILREANVIGITTTSAAKHREILKSLNSEIVIVEEAAEVLEGHVLASLTSAVKHLVLIGDHLQLRPSTAVYKLTQEHKLDVSMFERLLRSGVEHVMLQEQRRMRPSFSKLVKSLYPELKDHESVLEYEDIKGVRSNLLFFDHTAEENTQTVEASKVNTTEAKLVVELTLYLLKQGYSASNIAILSMYSGQLMEIKKILSESADSRLSSKSLEHSRKMQKLKLNMSKKIREEEADEDSDEEEADERRILLPRVSSVDDFQGEESDIIILSLVRSNEIQTRDGEGTIGFLKTSNRICVALTRARKGMYIFGNATLLAKRSALWRKVTNGLREDGALDTKLELYCQNHPDTKTIISKEADFKQVVDGGCSRPCETQLNCGHVCPRRCHPGSHDDVVCPKVCSRQYSDCHHTCYLKCHDGADCPLCPAIVQKTMPACGHLREMSCYKDPGDEVCNTPCTKILECLHKCNRLCGSPCTIDCMERVAKILPCGHETDLYCHEDPEKYSCKLPCRAILSDCEHECGGDCGRCKNGTEHILCKKKCGRILPCGHPCEAGCSAPCPPCWMKCQKRCFHSKCPRTCGQICVPCLEPCPWSCEHHKCELRCHEICSRPRCDLPCLKVLNCGHPCIGLCGDPCPTKCRTCDPTTRDIITLMTLEEYEETDRFVQLQDCKHLFEVSGLDTWIDAEDTQAESGRKSAAIKLKECPECKSTVWRSTRYANVVKSGQKRLEDVKKKMFGYEKTRQGLLKLQQDDSVGALSDFCRALEQNPGLMDAHLGAGLAFSSLRKFDSAAEHLSFIVEKSSYAADVSNLLKRTDRLNRVFGTWNASYSSPNTELSNKAMLQLASVYAMQREYTNAERLCDVVIQQNPGNQDALTIKESAKKGLLQMVVQVMSGEVGEKGHWYQCPNGHYYTIGECGGAMQQSKCPDCKADVGGAQHRLTAGNRHADIDGSSRPAWPGP